MTYLPRGFFRFHHRLPRTSLLAAAAWSAVAAAEAGTVTVDSVKLADTPAVQGYNLGLFMPGSNAADWWRYSGANAARVFLHPSNFPTMGSNGVATQSAFLSARTALRANPLSSTYFNWPDLENRFENTDIGGYRINHAVGTLGGMGVDALMQITASETSLPISASTEWRDKWRLWKHYYAMSFHLARRHNVRRYQMFNEPDHANANGLTPENWLTRLQLSSDAIRCAIADVNALYGKNLAALIYAPTSAGSSFDATWEGFAFANRRTDFLGRTDALVPLFDRYDYHHYDSAPSAFGNRLRSNRAAMIAALPSGEAPLPIAITELNVNSSAALEATAETLDTPARFSRLGAILAAVGEAGLEEIYFFKFTQTASDSNASGVAKNGTHHADTANFPHNHGGATQAAEVARLFMKGFAPGREIVGARGGGALEFLEFLAARDPVSGTGSVWCVNDSSSPEDVAVDVTAWGLPDGTPALLEQVGDGLMGAVAPDGLTTVSAGRLPARPQASGSVWLYSIASGPSAPPALLRPSDDATLRDGTNRNAAEGSASSLLAKADDADPSGRGVAVMRFPLPVIYPPDIQFAVLELSASTPGSAGQARAFVYGLVDDAWNEQSATWAAAAYLRQGVAAGNLIRNNVVAGAGASVFLQGQLAVTGPAIARRQLDVTGFVRGRLAGRAASFLVAQEYRWDRDIAAGTAGDPQTDGVLLVSDEGDSAAAPGPRLRVLRRADTDGDGLSDAAETADFATDPARADTDGDGATDGAEYIAGTDPRDASSRFRIVRIGLVAAGVELEWTAVAGRRYLVERTTTLAPADWRTVGDVSAAGARQRWTHAGGPGASSAFYRVRLP